MLINKDAELTQQQKQLEEQSQKEYNICLNNQDFSCQTNIDKSNADAYKDIDIDSNVNINDIHMPMAFQKSNSHRLLKPKLFRNMLYIKPYIKDNANDNGNEFNYDQQSPKHKVYRRRDNQVNILTQLEEKVLETFLNTNIPIPQPKQPQEIIKVKVKHIPKTRIKGKVKVKDIKLPFIEEPKHYHSKSNSKKLYRDNNYSKIALTYTQKLLRDKMKTINQNQEKHIRHNAFLFQNIYTNNILRKVPQGISINNNNNSNSNKEYNKEKDNSTYRGFSFQNEIVKEKIANSILHSTRAANAKSTNHFSYITNFAELLYI